MFDKLNLFIDWDTTFNPQIAIDCIVYCSLMLEKIILPILGV